MVKHFHILDLLDKAMVYPTIVFHQRASEKGNIFVYDIDDWTALRKSHRIVGHIIGNTAFIPSLPCKLLPEEALLLLDKGLAELRQNSDAPAEPDISVGAGALEEALLEAQRLEYTELRRKQLSSLLDTIVEKRRALGDDRPKEDIFNEELSRSPVITKENMIWPILLKEDSQNTLPVPKANISVLTTSLRTVIFKDLWERGYYITSGEKFGGDFLVYLGDPIIHHAVFIVKCIESERTIMPTELVALGRLGVSVKKRFVLGSCMEGKVNYMTIDWINA